MLNSFYHQERSNYDIFNQHSLHNEIKRSLRATQGFPEWQFVCNGGEDEQKFLADRAGLKEEDRRDEQKLSASLSGLLKNCMEIRNDFLAAFADGDLSDGAKLQDFYARSTLKILKP